MLAGYVRFHVYCPITNYFSGCIKNLICHRMAYRDWSDVVSHNIDASVAQAQKPGVAPEIAPDISGIAFFVVRLVLVSTSDRNSVGQREAIL